MGNVLAQCLAYTLHKLRSEEDLLLWLSHIEGKGNVGKWDSPLNHEGFVLSLQIELQEEETD